MGQPFLKMNWQIQIKNIKEKTKNDSRRSYARTLKEMMGSVKNIRLIDKENIHNNQTYRYLNQYTTDGGQRVNRYDVTVLVNGLPLVHIELKRRGVAIQEAFNQICRYQRESFWAG